QPHGERAGTALRIAIAAVVVATFGAVIVLTESNAMHEALRMVGLAGEKPIEAVLRKQAAAVSRLDATVEALNAAMAGLRAPGAFSGEREEATPGRMAEIDGDLGALRKSMDDLRAAKHAAAADEPWRKPMAQLTASVTRARGEIYGLRASLDELAQTRHPGL